MSEKTDISRRKALATSSGIGGAVLGIPSVAAGDSDEPVKLSEEELELTESEIARELSETELIVGTREDGRVRHERDAELELQTSDIPDDVDIYVGEYQNADVPTGKPFAVESLEEYLERDAPPGFESDGELTTHSAPEFYFKETLASPSFAGYSVDIAIGVGGEIVFDGTSVYAALTFDLHTGPITTTLFSQSIGLGASKDGLCFDRISIDYGNVPGFSVDGCLDVSFSSVSSGYQISVGVSIDACADPCPIGSCDICHGVGGSLGHTV